MPTRLIATCLIVLLSITTVNSAEPSVAISDITWQLGPNLPEFRKGGCATVLDDKLISVFGMRQPWGEMATMYVYDPETNIWQPTADGPIGQTYVQGTEFHSPDLGEVFYSIGGRSSEQGGVHPLCFRLSTQGNTYRWEPAAQLNHKRGWAPSVALGAKLYVFGGALSGRGPTLSSVEVLDTSASEPQWELITNIPGPSRGWCGAVAVAGKIYVLGGSHIFEQKPSEGQSKKRLREVWQLEPDTGTWQARSPLPYRVSGIDTCVYRDRYIILVGGAADQDDFSEEMRAIVQRDRFHASYYSPFVLVYDTQTDHWQRMPSTLPVATNDIRVTITGNTLYALGGENIEPATSNTTPWLRIGEIVDTVSKP